MPPTLPAETVDQILGHVGPYDDVLNVALCSRAFSSVAIPYHLHYRDIRSKLHHEELWSWLSRRDDLHAANIRSLTIINDSYDVDQEASTEYSSGRRERVPVQFSRSEDQHPHLLTVEDRCEAEIRLISALRRMSCLHQFRWYRSSRPVLHDDGDDIWTTLERLGTVKVLDILDLDVDPLFVPITLSSTFLRLSGFTSLTLEIYNPEIRFLEQMLLDNCPDLEVLSLNVKNRYHQHLSSTERLLQNAHWPNLRVLRLQGALHCRVAELVRFLIAHPTIEELALARMMPGHGWPEFRLSSDALPNLRHLECSSAQAAALLRSGSACHLETLRGVEVHDRVRIADYFDQDVHWGDEDEQMVIPSPWKALFLKCAKAQTSLIRLGVVQVEKIQEFETLARIAPQLKELDVHVASFSMSNAEWNRSCSLFPSLEVTRTTLCFQRDCVDKISDHIRGLVAACPSLRLIRTGAHLKKVVIIRSGKSKGVRWVVRNCGESEDPIIKVGEHVYGLSLQ